MGGATTIVFPDSTVSAFTTAGGVPSAIPSTPSGTGLHARYVATITSVELYISLSVTPTATVTLSKLIEALGATYSGTSKHATVYGHDTEGTTPLISDPVTTVTTSGLTLYVPVTGTPSGILELQTLIKALNAASPTADPGSGNGTSTITTSSSLSALSSGPTQVSPSAASSQRSSTPAQKPSVSPTNIKSKGGISAGALGGSIVAAFTVGGLICALIAWLCLRRRNPRRASLPAGSNGSNNEKPLPSHISKKEAPPMGAVTSDLTGWQKHLPQDKDDGAITKAFQSVFEQVQIHTEGFYEAKFGAASRENIDVLNKLSYDDLPEMLYQTNEAVMFLEGILVRFIVHRISGRSSAEESFLPSEFTKIPEKNKWHMEKNADESGFTAEHRRGFPQAFSHWRRLTGFLGPDPRTDQASRRELDTKVEKAVTTLIDAFSPWESPGKSNTNRRESLRRILLQASGAGILLFTQPSTFMFDWSTTRGGNGRTVVITPALVRRLDESAEALERVHVLLEARVITL